MFHHTHPYPPFIPKFATKLIVGTLPPPRFTMGMLNPGDVDFCYGSRDGLLWPILDRMFSLNLSFETTQKAIDERKAFLERRGIGICDIVSSAKRKKIDASDLGMLDPELRDLIKILEEFPNVNTLLFTGGNSKNGPEYFFRQLLKTYNIKLELVSDEIPREHEFYHPKTGKSVRTISLTAPSGSANRAVGSMEAYKLMKQNNPELNTIDFRVLQYKKFF